MREQSLSKFKPHTCKYCSPCAFLIVIANIRHIIVNWNLLNSDVISAGMSVVYGSCTTSFLWDSLRIIASIRLFMNYLTTYCVQLHDFDWLIMFRNNIIGSPTLKFRMFDGNSGT